MGNNNKAVDSLRHMVTDQDRTYIWLSRQTGIPYKRILAEVKNSTRPISLDTALASASALGVGLPELVGTAA